MYRNVSGVHINVPVVHMVVSDVQTKVHVVHLVVSDIQTNVHVVHTVVSGCPQVLSCPVATLSKCIASLGQFCHCEMTSIFHRSLSQVALTITT